MLVGNKTDLADKRYEPANGFNTLYFSALSLAMLVGHQEGQPCKQDCCRDLNTIDLQPLT